MLARTLRNDDGFGMAERLDDLICNFEVSMEDGIESFSVLIIGWVLFLAISAFGLQALWRFGKRKKNNEPTRRSPIQSAEIKANNIYNSESSDKNDAFDSYFMSKVRSALPFKEAVSQRLNTAPTAPCCEFTIPSATGDDCVQVEWVNSVIAFILKNNVVKNDIVNAWVSTVNDQAVERATENGVNFRIIDVVRESSSIEFSSVNVDSSSEDSLCVNALCTCSICMTVGVTCHRSPNSDSVGGAETWRPHCRVWARLTSPTHLNLSILQQQSVVIGRFSNADPQVEVDIHTDEPRSDVDWSPLQERVDLQCIGKAVSTCLSSAVTNFYYTKYNDWPKASNRRHQRSLQSASNFRCQSVDPAVTDPVTGHQPPRRLLVRIVKASALRPIGDELFPECVVEMDEPLQRYHTQPATEAKMPFWNEEFVFDLSDNTAEILFELFAVDRTSNSDRSTVAGATATSARQRHHGSNPIVNNDDDNDDDDRFLGLGIVGVDELLVSPSQRQIISLLSRPGRNDPVTGSLTVEFLFVDERSRGVDVAGGDECETGRRHMTERVLPSGSVLQTTRTTYSRPSGVEDSSYVTNMALDDMKTTAKPNATKSTLIIHSSKKVKRNEDGLWVEVSMKDDSALSYDETSTINNESCPDNGAHLPTTSNSLTVPDPLINDSSAAEEPNISPSRQRSGVFGSLRKRMGSMKKERKRGVKTVDRATSLQPYAVPRTGTPDDKDRPRASTLSRSYKTGKRLSVGTIDRRSVGGASGISTGSDGSFVTEQSALVIETHENGIIRHFMVPSGSASQYRSGKKFSKLHIYNEHIFVAKHVRNAVCGVCDRPLSRWFGKQAYECRDCQLCVHKHCHVLVQLPCPNSTVHTMQMSAPPGN